MGWGHEGTLLGWGSGGAQGSWNTQHPRAAAKLQGWLQAQPKVPNLGVTDPAATTEQQRNRKGDPRSREQMCLERAAEILNPWPCALRGHT